MKNLRVREIITLKGWLAGSGWSYQECYSDKIVEVAESDLQSLDIDWSWWETDIDNPPGEEGDTKIIVEYYPEDAEPGYDEPLARFEKWASEIWAERHAE